MDRDERPTERSAYADDARYQRLMAATRAAARDGYDAVSMRELAERGELSMTTIYQFCRSKDQLIAEAHVEGMTEFRRRITARPPKGATATERVGAVMRSYATALEVDETRSRTLMRAIDSIDPDVGAARASTARAFRSMIELAVGEDDIEDREAPIGALGHVVDSVIVGWLSRRHDSGWVRAELQGAVRVLIRPIAPRATAPPPARSRRAPRADRAPAR